MEDAFKELDVARPARRADLINAPGGPGMDRRIDIGKGKFVGGNLAVGVHVPLTQEQHQLLLWRMSGRDGQTAACEMRDPRRQTRGIPIYPASKSRPGCRHAASRGFVPDQRLAGGTGAVLDLPSASP